MAHTEFIWALLSIAGSPGGGAGEVVFVVSPSVERNVSVHIPKAIMGFLLLFFLLKRGLPQLGQHTMFWTRVLLQPPAPPFFFQITKRC